jgi:hypothetical protein
MSFIYDDPNLVVKLMSNALEHDFKFTKRGQDAMQQARANVLALVKNLQTQLDPNQTQAPKVAWEGDANKKPTMDSRSLESLGDLVNWVIANKITVNGQRVAYSPTEITGDPPTGWIHYNLETHTATPEQRGAKPGGFFVNAKLIQTYIGQLQAHESQNPNPAMKLQLGKLVEETNTDLGTNIGSQYQAPEKVLRDTVVLDNVPDIFVDVKSSGYGGDIPLTYGDLKDDMSFNSWLKNKAIQFLSQVNGKSSQISFGAPGFDECAVLKILMYRAAHKSYTTAEEKEQSQIYARQISNIAKELNCDLSGQGAAPGATATQGGQQGQDASGLSGQQLQNVINEIVDTLPLQLQNIDFSRIRTFLGKMAQLMGNNPTVTNYISSTNELMTKASSLTKSSDTFFQLGISPGAVVNMLKPNDKGFAAANFFSLLQLLDQIVDNVRALVGYFMSGYASKVTDKERADIYGQIGRRPDDTSIYSRNVEYLNQLMNTRHN